MNLPHTKRMAPDFFEKIQEAIPEAQKAGQLPRFVRACARIERQYKAIEASALEVRRLWRPWAGEDGRRAP